MKKNRHRTSFAGCFPIETNTRKIKKHLSNNSTSWLQYLATAGDPKIRKVVKEIIEERRS